MSRHYSPRKKARRDANFHRRNNSLNPIRFRVALPADVADSDDILWTPTREEKLLDRLKEMKAQWDAEDAEHADRVRKLRLAAVTEMIQADERRYAEQLRLEEARQHLAQEIQKIQDYYTTAHEREQKAEDDARRKRAAKLAKVISKDSARAVVKSERELFASRGLIRGRRK